MRRHLSTTAKMLQLLLLLVLTTVDGGVNAFASSKQVSFRLSAVHKPTRITTPTSFAATTTTTTTTTTTARPMMGGWEDVVFNAESVASTWASVSLEDPSNLITSLPIMYGAGLLTSLSPCVWGLLPLTMSYISNAAGERADQQTTLPTLAFAAGLAAVFCTLGVTAAQLGDVFGSSSGGSPNDVNWIAIGSNVICLLMGMQLLELIRVPLPSLDFLRERVNPSSPSSSSGPILLDGSGKILNNSKNNHQNSQEQGSLFRTFLLGGSSALMASPCATPVLTSILAFVARTQDPILGGALLLGYTLGYSTPLLLLASTGGQALVDLKKRSTGGGAWAKIAPWVTPFTAGILLWYGTNGFLTAILGDPSLAGLQILE